MLSSGVEYAHAAGLIGNGQVIGVVDAGFSRSHEALAGALEAESPSSVVDDHGTAVAAVIAGQSGGFVGMAPGATLYASDFYDDAAITSATYWALANGAVAQNNSWGYLDSNGAEVKGNTAGFNYIFGSRTGADYLQALRAYSAEGVVVFTVTNDTNASVVGIMEALPNFAPDLEEGWIAVANGMPTFDGSGDLVGVDMMSGRCLTAARWCITANGQWENLPVNVDASDTTYGRYQGSSFAAPQVSGALAILGEAFPDMDPHQLRLRLLASADDAFFHDPSVNAGTVYEVELIPGYFEEYSTVYGHGFLDIAAALLPIGTPSMAISGGQSLPFEQARFTAGSATGDAVTRALSATGIDITDDFGGKFEVSGASLATASQPRDLASTRMTNAIVSDLSRLRTAPLASGRSAFADNEGRSLAVASPFGDFSASVLLPEGGPDAGLEFSRSFGGNGLRFDLGLKLAHEESGLIGFGSKGADLAGVRLGLATELDTGGFFSVGAEFGVADLDAPNAAFTSLSTARYDSFGAEIGQKGVFSTGDRVALGVSLPVAVTGGRAEVTVPTSGPAARSVLTPIAFDLAPSERQLDMSFSYQTPLGDRAELLFEVIHAENFGNQAGRTDTAGIVALSVSF